MDAIVYDKVGKEAEKVREALYGIYPQENITDAAIASFDDGADGIPVKKLVANIEPVQDLHGYDNPWPAGGNVNKLSPANTTTPATHNELTITPYADGKYHAKKTGTSLAGNVAITLETPIPVTTSDYFTPITTSAPSGAFHILLLDANENTLCSSSLGKVSSQITSAGTAAKIQFYTSEEWSGEADIFPMISSSAVTTYSPYSNICPISGWTGAEIVDTGINIWDEEWESGSYLDDGTPIPYNTRIRSKNRIIVKPNTRYYINASQNNYELYILCYDANSNLIVKQLVRNNVFATPSQACYILFFVASLATYNNDISINYPATDTEYHAYTGSQISVTFPSQAGTVYGGTLTINPDRTGSLVVDKKYLDLSSISFNKNADYWYSTIILNDAEDPVSFYNVKTKLISDRYRSVTPAQIVAKTYLNSISYFTSSLCGLMIYNGDLTTAPTGEIVYPLATPTTYQLTASEISAILTTLYGTNNIWADTGNIEELTYRADLGKYIDSHITTAVANALNA